MVNIRTEPDTANMLGLFGECECQIQSHLDALLRILKILCPFYVTKKTVQYIIIIITTVLASSSLLDVCISHLSYCQFLLKSLKWFEHNKQEVALFFYTPNIFFVVFYGFSVCPFVCFIALKDHFSWHQPQHTHTTQDNKHQRAYFYVIFSISNQPLCVCCCMLYIYTSNNNDNDNNNGIGEEKRLTD